MFEKLNKYIEENLILLKDPPSIREDEKIYGVKNITLDLRSKFEKLKVEENMPKWDLECCPLIHMWKGLGEKEIKEVRENLVNREGISLPKSFITYLMHMNGISTDGFRLFGHNGYGAGPSSIYFNRLQVFPIFINKNFLNVGKYSPDNSPIFINQEGNIFVYSGEQLFIKKDDISKNKTVNKCHGIPLIAYWDNLEDFITEETIRYIELFIKKPFSSAKLDMLPQNVTFKKLHDLYRKNKI